MNIKDLPCHRDERGEIQMIIESAQVGSVSKITSVSNSFRANHFHRNDNHTILITKNWMEIYESPISDVPFKPVKTILQEGDLHFTSSMVLHTMFFPVDCEFLCFSKLSRTQDNYESETIRFENNLRDIYLNWED